MADLHHHLILLLFPSPHIVIYFFYLFPFSPLPHIQQHKDCCCQTYWNTAPTRKTASPLPHICLSHAIHGQSVRHQQGEKMSKKNDSYSSSSASSADLSYCSFIRLSIIVSSEMTTCLKTAPSEFRPSRTWRAYIDRVTERAV